MSKSVVVLHGTILGAPFLRTKTSLILRRSCTVNVGLAVEVIIASNNRKCCSLINRFETSSVKCWTANSCIHASRGPVIIINQLKSVYNSPFKDWYLNSFHICFPIIASNVFMELVDIWYVCIVWKFCYETDRTKSKPFIHFAKHWYRLCSTSFILFTKGRWFVIAVGPCIVWCYVPTIVVKNRASVLEAVFKFQNDKELNV